MQAKDGFKRLLIVSIVSILGIFLALTLSASKSINKKVAIVFTGGLGELFHPMGEDPDQEKKIKCLEDILEKLRKSNPEAIFVDTGNFLSVPDYVETHYGTKARRFFRKHHYDAANLGTNEIFKGPKIHLFHATLEKGDPCFLSTLIDKEKNRDIALPFVDIDRDPRGAIRILGATSFNHIYSAPPLENMIEEPDRLETLSSLLVKVPSPDVSLLLSDLPHEDNINLAEKLPSLDLVLESHTGQEDPVKNVNETFLCHRAEPGSVGLLTFEIASPGEIKKIKFRTYPLRKKGGLFSLFKKKKYPHPEPPLPYLGKIVPKERYFEKLSVSYDKYEIRRFHAHKFIHLLKSPQIYYYELYKKDNPIGRTFYVEHALGERRPIYMFFVTLDMENRIREIDVIMIPFIGNWDMHPEKFMKSILGKKWDEIQFDPRGFEGGTREYRAFFQDISLVSQLAETYIE